MHVRTRNSELGTQNSTLLYVGPTFQNVRYDTSYNFSLIVLIINEYKIYSQIYRSEFLASNI